MPQTSFALMTTLGRSKEAAALANATTIEITEIAIGDGVTVPSGGETSLYNEVDRFPIAAHGVVVGASNVAYFDAFLAAEDGPYTIREAGLYDSEGDLIAIAHYNPAISKPTPESGQTVEGTVRLEVAFSNVANITIVVDPSMQVALQRLSRLPWIPVISMTTTAPPSSPTVGDCYLVPSGATGAWSGQAGKIAERTVAGWAIFTPADGHGISLPDGRVFERISGSYVEKIALDVQSAKWNYSAIGGTSNAITATLSPAPGSLTVGMRVCITTTATNTNVGPTLNVNGLGAATIVSQRGVAVPAASLPVGVCEFIWSGTAWVFMGTVVQPLQAPLTLYVRTDGNNANSGLANTAGGAFATLQGAYNAVLARYSANGYPVTIVLGTPGTYVGLVHNDWPGRVVVVGDTVNRANYIITPSSLVTPVACSFTSKELYWTGVKFQASSSGQRLFQTNGGQSVLVSCDWQSAGGAAMLIGESAGRITLTGTHNFAGSTSSLFAALSGSQIFLGDASPFAGIVTGSPSISVIATAQTGGLIEVRNGTMSGGVTGTRYNATTNGVINTSGAGANYFPGTVAGATATGGQYV